MSGPVPNVSAHGPPPGDTACEPSPGSGRTLAGPVPISGSASDPPASSPVPEAGRETSACGPPPGTTPQRGDYDQGGLPNCVPKVGMTFNSENEAYDFYNSYARNVGFSIRKNHTKTRADGSLCSKYFLCSNEGQPVASTAQPGRKKKRASTRSDCKARLQFYITREGIWTVQKVELDHNHYLVSPDKSHMLRSQRRLMPSYQQVVNQMRNEGITAADIQRVFQQWCRGGENVHLLKKDTERKYLQPSYALTLLEYLKNKQTENPSFFYAVQLNDDGRIANFFWTDCQAIVDYACFGDVMSFDTTFETNRFEMPFAPFVGTNHHKQPIVFGAALLYDESSESFHWLFQTFLTAMSGKQPVTIFTDPSAEITKAIRLVFSNSSHRLCLRHICHNAVKHFNHVICNHPEFLSDFERCIYEERSVAFFDLKWKEFVKAYNLEGNDWMNNLYAMREKWAAVYSRDSFYADMMSTQNAEGTNNALKNFRRKLCLPEFLEEYEKFITSLRQKELEADYNSRHTSPVPYVPDLPMLKTAAESYTRNLYSHFEEEFKKLFTLSCSLLSQDRTISTYKLTPLNSEEEAYVVFNPEDTTVSCSCRMYECTGMLCKHALRVLNYSNIFALPSHYVYKRWTKCAKAGLFFCRNNSQSGNGSSMLRCARISQKMHSVALRYSMSEKALQFLESGVDKLTWEVENLLGHINLNGNDISQSSGFCNSAMAESLSHSESLYSEGV
ncbi:hypothetical protein E2562_038522 [Oryza meyeriana var. granulata]|uniref:SWIM-type domain-containing protein n=1 Tax=Oryza meyeriana var. granulata TaxID=110450 RepID=A0A6G1FGZ2_9ORYZ|nr:hypothetical protein E2562_038522 [Oryza meyeriana var. granulata]